MSSETEDKTGTCPSGIALFQLAAKAKVMSASFTKQRERCPAHFFLFGFCSSNFKRYFVTDVFSDSKKSPELKPSRHTLVSKKKKQKTILHSDTMNFLLYRTVKCEHPISTKINSNFTSIQQLHPP